MATVTDGQVVIAVAEPRMIRCVYVRCSFSRLSELFWP